MLDDSDHYANAINDVSSGYAALRPPRRVSVSQGAADNLVIKQPGGYVGPWSLSETPYMAEPMDMQASRRHEAVCFVGPARTGKCIDETTPILTTSGWVQMGALVEGDYVYGPDGNPTRVLAAHATKYDLPCFSVGFSDGTCLVTDSEHLWGVERFYWKAPHWRYEVRSTESLIADIKYGGRFRYHVRNTEPLTISDVELAIDPYLFGVWLGDGATSQGVISAHKDDASFYESHLTRAGHTFVTSCDGENTVRIAIDLRHRLTTHCRRGHEFAVVGQVSNKGCRACLNLAYARRTHGAVPPPFTLFTNTFTARLHALGVFGNKHIPATYLRAGTDQRWALLRGLMDTDGSFDRRSGSVEFVSTSDMLVDGFVELARSLGFKPVVKRKATTWAYKGVRKHGDALRVTFPVPTGGNPFALPRKAEQFMAASVDVGYRQITAITPVASRPVRCISVDNDSHLFLAGRGMIPTHNTMGLLEGWAAHVITNDPGDMLIVQMTQDKAREYSKTRIDRMLRHSPNVHALKSSSSQDDNTHDKQFKHGMWLRIGWPTVSQLSSSDYRYVALTDYDRMPTDIDGEGSAFALGLKRTTTFLSRGMCLVESSPGYDMQDPAWAPITAHEAPPAEGIMSIYNRSDRRRWYWKCYDCREWYEAAPGMSLFNLPQQDELMTMVREADIDALSTQYARIVCPHCGCIVEKKHKHDLNMRGRWVQDGQVLTADNLLVGTAMTSSIAGYWLGGVAAAYQPWKSLVMRYMQGLREYALNGSELTLKTTVNTDQGMPYMSMLLQEAAAGETNPADRADTTLTRYVVPPETRFLTAAVDVQGGTNARFVVQVHAHGTFFENWLVDRYEIKDSRREGMGTEFAPIDPASYAEDWDCITEKVIRSTYRTTLPGLELRIKMVAVDTGGEDGVTANAYAWFRRLRKESLHKRVMLIKGASAKGAPIIKETMVGNRHGREKGDVPVYLLNMNLLKDAVHAGIQRQKPGAGYYHFPAPKSLSNPSGWLPRSFFDELSAEVRNKDGNWMQIRKRNESLDLCSYNRAAALRLGADKIKSWLKPPAWAKLLAANSEVITVEDRRDMKSNELVEPVAAPAPVVAPVRLRHRRVATSNYMR